MNKLQKKAETMITMHVKGHDHVLVKAIRDSAVYADPNYKYSNMALCGMLAEGQSLESFKENWIKRKSVN